MNGLDGANVIDLRSAGGSTVAQRLLQANMNVNALRTNGTLRKDEWKEFDEAILKAAQQRMQGVADLKSRNLVHRIGNGLGTTVFEYEDVSDMRGAEVTMDGVSRVKNDQVIFDLKNLPLPLIHKDFQIGVRKLNASRTRGESLDTTQAEISAAKCAELSEQILFNGYNSFTFGGGIIYGYTDVPTRNTVEMAKKWTVATGEEIVADVIAMKQAAIDARHYGPYVIYIPTAYETVIDDDYKANSDRTLRERIKAITGIEDIKVADHLAVDNVLLVEMQKETVRMVEGLPITNVEWQSEGNMMFHFKVMMIEVPQIRADQYGRSGIVHLAEVES